MREAARARPLDDRRAHRRDAGRGPGTQAHERERAVRVDVRRAAGFARVAVDLRGFRSGSLNVLAGVRPG